MKAMNKLLLAAGRITAGALLAWLGATAPAHAAESGRDYTLGPGDMVRITVFQSPELTLDTRVAESGVVSYPLLGSVRLGGRTPAQAESAIANGLKAGGFVRDPQVSVLVQQVRANQVSVLGMVNRPGRYPLDVTGMRLSEVLALAGGVVFGGADTVVLTGTREGKPIRQEIDLVGLLGRAKGDDPVLQNGDALFVERAPMVYVYGEVQRPGQLRLERNMNVMQALAAAGGLNLKGTEKGMRLNRLDASGTLRTQDVTPDLRLQDGDVLFVRESLF